MNIQDPDYESITKSPTKRILSDDLKVEKICNIINREFSTEIERKEKEIDLIDQRLLLAKKTLHRLRYAIVNSYYNSKQYHLNEEDIRREIVSQKDPIARAKVHSLLKDEQKRLHPALKKLLGEKPTVNLDEVLKVRPPRKRNKAESDAGPSTSENITIPVDDSGTLRSHVKCEIKTEPIDNYVVVEPSNVKIPRYVQPNDMEKNVIKIDIAIRNKQKEKFRIIIGNTSKYTPPHSEMDRSTHRWLLYIRGPRDKPDVSHFIDSVVVKLDSSYAPHNIIKLNSPPFHLSRRGWGEFAVNLRIHFKNERLNKPVNLIHNLKLDRNYTGLQTLGSETVVDVWLYCDETMIEKELDHSNYILKSEETDYPKLSIVKCESHLNEGVSLNNLENETIDKTSSFHKSTLLSPSTLLKLKSSKGNPENQSNILQPLIKASSMDQNKVLDVRIFDQKDVQDERRGCFSSETNLKSTCSSKSRHSLSNQKTKSLVKTHPNSLLKISDSSESENSSDEFKMTHISDVIDGQHSINIKAFLEDHCYVNQSYMLQACFISESVNHPTLKSANNVSNLINISKQLIIPCTIRDPVNANCSESKASEILRSLENFFNLNIVKMDSIRSAVGIMLKKMPIIHEMANVEEFQRLFPYAVKTEEEFFKLNFIKRRNLEWTRAKIIKNLIMSHWIPPLTSQVTKMWSVKQIILFSHYHGYYPVKTNAKYGRSSDIEFTSKMFNLPFVQEGKINYGFKNVGEINSLTNINEFKEESTNKITKESLKSQHYLMDISYNGENSEDEVDICNVEERTDFEKKQKFSADKLQSTSESIQFADTHEKLMCSYIERICAKQGIQLKMEDIGNGYSDCLAHKTMLSAVKCLVEDILRRSLAVKITSQMEQSECDGKTLITKCRRPLWESTEHGVPHEVNLRHVYEAISTRQELDLLTNSGLGTAEMDYIEKI